MTTTTETAPTCSAPAQAISLPCPCCGSDAAGISVRLDLIGLEGEPVFTCAENNCEFDQTLVRNLIAKWSKVLLWIETLPQFSDDE